MSAVPARAYARMPDRADLEGWLTKIRATHDLKQWAQTLPARYGVTNPAEVPGVRGIVQFPAFAPITLANGSVRNTWVCWESGIQQVITDETCVEAEWRVQRDKTHQHTGVATVRVDPATGVVQVAGLPAGTAARIQPAATPRGFARLLEQVSRAGVQAEFAAVSAFEEYLDWLVERKNLTVGSELTYGETVPTEGPSVVAVDPISAAQVKTELQFGRPEQQSVPVLFRILRRAATTDVLANVPVATFVHVQLASATETAIRRHIADPHIGRRIRRFVRETYLDRGRVPAGVEEILADWRARYRGGRPVGVKQVTDALLATREPLPAGFALDVADMLRAREEAAGRVDVVGEWDPEAVVELGGAQ